MKHSRLLALALPLVAALILAGCHASKGQKLAAANSKHLAVLSEKATGLRDALLAARDAMNTVARSPERQKSYKAFSRKVAALESLVSWFDQQGAQTAARYTQLGKEWDNKLAQVQDPAIRALLETEKNKLLEPYETLPGRIRAASAAVAALNVRLHDLQKLLSLSLSDDTLGNAADILRALDAESDDATAQLQDIATRASELSQSFLHASGNTPKKDEPAPASEQDAASENPADPDYPMTDPDHRPAPMNNTPAPQQAAAPAQPAPAPEPQPAAPTAGAANPL